MALRSPSGAESAFAAARRLDLARIHLAVLLFGLAGLFGKFLDLPAIAIVFGRVVFASAALGLVAFSSARRKPAAREGGAAPGAPPPGGVRPGLRLGSARAYAALALSGLVLALHWTAFFQSIRVSSVAIGLVSFATFPLFVVFLEPLFSGDRLRARDVAVAATTLAGAALVVPELSLGNASTRGVLWGLASAATFALLSLFNRRSVQRIPSLTIALHQDLWAALVLAPFAAPALARVARWSDLGLLALLGLACTALAHTLFIGGMRSVRARTASVIASLEPVYGIVFALALLGEVPSLRTLAGGAVILGAAFYSTIRGR